MVHLIYAAIILVGIGLFFYFWNNEHRAVVKVAKEKEEIECEEHRMFDFLHGLGEELLEDSSPSRMHRYIVRGITEVLGSDAGILYLVDAERGRIVPVAQTEGTAAILPLPEELVGIETEKGIDRKYRSYIRLSPLQKSQGIVGEALAKSSTLVIEDLADYFEGDEASPFFHKGVAALATPLVYARKKIGVMVITRPSDLSFSANERDLFGSVTEQSSFALGSALMHAEAHEKRRLENELSQASEIQRILLPKKDPELDNFRLAATYRPARHVSGDYYDYVKVDEDHYGVVIADVCGKGIAASLIMAMCRSSLRSNCLGNLEPAPVLNEVNRSIFPDIREDMFVSFLYLIMERGSEKLSIANAGHEPPLIRRVSDGEIEIKEVPGMAVGVDKGPVFQRVVKNHELSMSTGDILLLYTDGLIEALNRKGEEFGFERLQESFKNAKGSSADEILDIIMSEIEAFSAGTNPTDDITLIAVEKR